MNLEFPAIATWVALILIAGLYDCFAVLYGRRTLSEVVWKYAKKYPAIPFFAGCLAGHLFL
jgi:hypothetical protein